MTKNLKEFLQEDAGLPALPNESVVPHTLSSILDPLPQGLDYALQHIQAGMHLGDGQQHSIVPLDNLLAAETVEYEAGKYIILKSEGEYVVAVEIQESGEIGARVHGFNGLGKYGSLITITKEADGAAVSSGIFDTFDDPVFKKDFESAGVMKVGVSEELVKKLEQYDTL